MFSILRNRYAHRSRVVLAFATVGLAVLLIVGAPQATPNGTSNDDLHELWKRSGKGLDRGVVEVFSSPSQPSG